MPSSQDMDIEAQYNDILQNDPELNRIRQGFRDEDTYNSIYASLSPDEQVKKWSALMKERVDALAQERGLPPLPRDYAFTGDQSRIHHKGWWERTGNWLVPALIAGGAIGGVGLAGGLVASGAGGGAASAGGAGAAGAAGAGSSAGAVAGTAGAVLPSTPLATTGLMTAPGIASGGAGAAATGATAATAGSVLPSTPFSIPGIATGGIPNVTTGGTTMASLAGGGGKGVTGFIDGLADKWGKYGEMVGGLGEVIGSATQASTQNRQAANEMGLEAHKAAITGRDAYEKQLNERARLEQTQRKQALADVYRQGWYQNRTPGPYNPKPFDPLSQSYIEGLGALAGEGSRRLAQPQQYGTDKFNPLTPYTEFEPQGPGTLERIGTWAGPILKGGEVVLTRGRTGYEGKPGNEEKK